MYFKKILILILFVFCACSEQSTSKEDLVEIRNEIEEIKVLLTDIKASKEVPMQDSIKNEIEEIKTIISRIKSSESIPIENRSKNEIISYINDICIKSSNKKRASSHDSQLFMLTALGNKNLNLLLEAYSKFKNNHYLRWAISKLVEKKDKDLIIKHLKKNIDLSEIVIKYNWEEDAKDILIEHFKQDHSFYSAPLINSIVKMKDPSVNKRLRNYLINGSNRTHTYEAIKNIPNIKIEEAVVLTWNKLKKENHREWEKENFAAIAFSYGCADSLPFVIKEMKEDKEDKWYPINDSRKAILKMTSAKGSVEEILAWYDEYKNNIFFDKQTKKYIIDKSRNNSNNQDSTEKIEF